MFGLAPPPDTSTCSDATDSIAQNIIRDWFGGLIAGQDLNNIRPFYDLVLGYLKNGPPKPDPEPETGVEEECPITPEPFEYWKF